MRKALPYPIYKVGVELEGGFLTNRPFTGGMYHEDTSVAIYSTDVKVQTGKNYTISGGYDDDRWDPYYDCPDRGENDDCECECCEHLNPDRLDTGYIRVGEYVSRPLSTWAGLTRFIDKCYPNVVNSSCGTHLHASTRNLVYMSQLMENADEIYDRLVCSLDKWSSRVLDRDEKDWMRLRLEGDNQFCRPKHNVKFYNTTSCNRVGGYDYDTDRYQALNFRALEEHGTIECRILPAFKQPQHLKEALHIIFTVYSKVLKKAKAKKKVICQITMPQYKLQQSKSYIPAPNIEYIHKMSIDTYQNLFNDRDRVTCWLNATSFPEPQEQNAYHLGSHSLNSGRMVSRVAKSAAYKGKKRRK